MPPNAVKHFKFELRGKRRLHKTPGQLEIAACHQWLQRELDAIEPGLIVAMGATAARALFGRITPIQKNRGRIIKSAQGNFGKGTAGLQADLLVTVHPSYLLRVRPDKEATYDAFVKDLKLAARYGRQR